MLLLAVAFARHLDPGALPRLGARRRRARARAILYPFYADQLFTIPVFGVWPDVATGVYMLVFIMMAVGLNIVVGYAGPARPRLRRVLRDRRLHGGLVRVAAVRGQKCPTKLSVDNCSAPVPKRLRLRRGRAAGAGGSTSRSGSLLLLAGVITALSGILIGLPTLRLRGDYLAIVTLGFGEILPQIARNGDNFFGTAST